mmetsp:Transcript_7025/g.12506  ORF Transcript_7025/g.12506 Transcript_7025/m.12506 type:complete len:231 (+) Transcript_7025:540-1232(+)
MTGQSAEEAICSPDSFHSAVSRMMAPHIATAPTSKPKYQKTVHPHQTAYATAPLQCCEASPNQLEQCLGASATTLTDATGEAMEPSRPCICDTSWVRELPTVSRSRMQLPIWDGIGCVGRKTSPEAATSTICISNLRGVGEAPLFAGDRCPCSDLMKRSLAFMATTQVALTTIATNQGKTIFCAKVENGIPEAKVTMIFPGFEIGASTLPAFAPVATAERKGLATGLGKR